MIGSYAGQRLHATFCVCRADRQSHHSAHTLALEVLVVLVNQAAQTFGVWSRLWRSTLSQDLDGHIRQWSPRFSADAPLSPTIRPEPRRSVVELQVPRCPDGSLAAIGNADL